MPGTLRANRYLFLSSFQKITMSNQPLLALHIINLIEVRIKDDISVFADSIRLAIKNNYPAKQIIAMIYDQIVDNQRVMEVMFGNFIIEKINQYATSN